MKTPSKIASLSGTVCVCVCVHASICERACVVKFSCRNLCGIEDVCICVKEANTSTTICILHNGLYVCGCVKTCVHLRVLPFAEGIYCAYHVKN